MTLAVLMIALFGLLAIGTPVGFAMGIAGAIGLYVRGGADMVVGVLAATPLSSVSSYELITIPMFLLMAEMVLASGVADDIFHTAAAWLGPLRGGLGMATALAGACFGAICGTSTGSAVTLAATSLPAMIKQGYEPRMAAGAVAISGTLAVLLPSSVALIVYGLLADVPIGQLMISGVIPSALITLTVMLTIAFLVWRDPSRAPVMAGVPLREKVGLLKNVGPMLLLFAVVTVSIYSGAATPTEASAFGAFGAFLLALLRGRLTWAKALHGFKQAAHASCMIAMILLGANIFSYAFALTQITPDLVSWVGALPVNRWVIVSLILCGYIVLGSFMDQLAILVLTVPVVLPLIKSLGFDPIWFGVIKMVTAEVGLITPPIGLNCYVVARYARRPVTEVFRGTFPHFVAHIIIIAVLVAFPALSMWLPAHMR
jgi:tripartite ATP-independent transporter DctM subunit